MSRKNIRLCKSCKAELSATAPAQQKFCSATCRERMKKRRQRLKVQVAEVGELERLQTVERHYDQLQTDHRKRGQRLTERDLKIRRLEHALQRTELQVDVVAEEQAQRTHDVRQQLATAKNEVTTLRHNWSARADADAAGPEVLQLRERLTTVTANYNALVAKYRQLTEAAQYAANERKHLQGIIRQWDSMCVRLYKATGGKPRRESDKKILSTWSQFRKLVGK